MIQEVKAYKATCDICKTQASYHCPVNPDHVVHLPEGWGIMYDFNSAYKQAFIDLCPNCLKDKNTYEDNKHP